MLLFLLSFNIQRYGRQAFSRSPATCYFQRLTVSAYSLFGSKHAFRMKDIYWIYSQISDLSAASNRFTAAIRR
jgi:hypothetical protein